jgi:hypothetical protein
VEGARAVGSQLPVDFGLPQCPSSDGRPPISGRCLEAHRGSLRITIPCQCHQYPYDACHHPEGILHRGRIHLKDENPS